MSNRVQLDKNRRLFFGDMIQCTQATILFLYEVKI